MQDVITNNIYRMKCCDINTKRKHSPIYAIRKTHFAVQVVPLQHVFQKGTLKCSGREIAPEDKCPLRVS